jgi:hypothetical protein
MEEIRFSWLYTNYMVLFVFADMRGTVLLFSNVKSHNMNWIISWEGPPCMDAFFIFGDWLLAFYYADWGLCLQAIMDS